MNSDVARHVFTAVEKFESLSEPKMFNVISLLLPGKKLYSILKLRGEEGYTEEWFNVKTNETSRQKLLGTSVGAAISSKVVNNSPLELTLYADQNEVLSFKFRY